MKYILSLSRPRFYLYTLGPCLLGLAAGFTQLSFNLILLAWLIYFTLPANLLLYGINDIFDYQTDKLNPKKTGFESLVPPKARKKVLTWILGLQLPFIPLFFNLPNIAQLYLALFIFLSIAYSAPPLRFKSKPFLDAASNILYGFPGFFLFALITNSHPPMWVFTSSLAWCAAMHAYSAIPDISIDKQAGISTIATLMGRHKTAVICGDLFFLSGWIAFSRLGFITLLLTLPYLWLCARAILYKAENVFSDYRYFPLVNGASGFVIFILTLFYLKVL